MPVTGELLWIACDACNLTARIRMRMTLPMSELHCPFCKGAVRAASSSERAAAAAHVLRHRS